MMDDKGEQTTLLGRIFDFFRAVRILVHYGSDTILRDPLTGLYNRRFFHEVAKKEIEQARRYKRPLTIAFFDVDELKKINDTLGHQEGDRVLKEVGQLILNNCRKSDIPARWGGDEFVVLLPETSEEAAIPLTERIIEKAGKIRLSYGLASWRDSFSSIEDFIAEVDKKMYVSKRAKKES